MSRGGGSSDPTLWRRYGHKMRRTMSAPYFFVQYDWATCSMIARHRVWMLLDLHRLA